MTWKGLDKIIKDTHKLVNGYRAANGLEPIKFPFVMREFGNGICACGCGKTTRVWHGKRQKFLRGHNKITEHNLLNRLFKHTKQSGDCLIWTGCKNNSGYGWITVKTGLTMGVHVIAWEFYNKKEIPNALEIHHKCFNRLCIKEEHLELVTRLENSRMRKKFYNL